MISGNVLGNMPAAADQTLKNRQPLISLRLTASYQSVDATGFEPATSASRTQRSTKLSHASIFMKHFVVSQIVLNYIITSFSVCPEKFCIFLIFLKFQTKPHKICDIMNSNEFILEVPTELRMRRKQRKKEDILCLNAPRPDFCRSAIGRTQSQYNRRKVFHHV